jgi:hypothetical protein
MSLDVSGLSTWTDENKMPLIKKSVLEGRTTQLITVQPDIKSSASINIIDSTLSAQAGSCGWNASGTTALTQRDLSVCPIKINESICLDTLESYYTQKMMNPGSYNEDIPFEQIYAEEKAGKINAMIEDIAWKGNTSTGSGNLALCDGFIALFDSLSGSTPAGNTGPFTAITASNIVDIVDGMVEAVPSDIIDADDLHLFMSYEDYRTYSKALRDANLFHYTGAEDQGQEFSQMIPGTNVRAIAVRGLNSTNRMFLSRAANLYFGTDLLNDAEDFKIFYSEDNDEVRFRAKFKMGVEVAFPEFVVDFNLPTYNGGGSL